MQYFPPSLTYLNAKIVTPSPTNPELYRLLYNREAFPRTAVFEAVGSHRLLNLPLRIRSWASKEMELHNDFFCANFECLQELTVDKLTVEKHTALPHTITKLVVKQVNHLDALPSSLRDLYVERNFVVPQGSPLYYRGFPPSLDTLTVGEVLNLKQALWLPAGLTRLSVSFEDHAMWLLFAPSDTSWHQHLELTGGVLPRSYPSLTLPTDDEEVVFLPKIEHLGDLRLDGSLLTCRLLPKTLTCLWLAAPQDCPSDFLEGLKDVPLLSLWIRGGTHWARFDELIPHLPRTLLNLNATNLFLDVDRDDLLRLPSLETLILHPWLEGGVPRKSHFFDPEMAAALPRSLHALEWCIPHATSMYWWQIQRFVAALPPRMTSLKIHERIQSYYFSTDVR